jgi:putative PIN family toxin of toxin-antitoxin system
VWLVLDTNVTISGLLWRGTPYRLLQAIRSQQPQQQIYTSPALLEELTEVITRPTFTAQLRRIGKAPAELLADYFKIVELVEPSQIRRVARDPVDDHVLACALAADAKFIISGDADILELKSYHGIPIRTVSAALKELTNTAPVTPVNDPWEGLSRHTSGRSRRRRLLTLSANNRPSALALAFHKATAASNDFGSIRWLPLYGQHESDAQIYVPQKVRPEPTDPLRQQLFVDRDQLRHVDD